MYMEMMILFARVVCRLGWYENRLCMAISKSPKEAEYELRGSRDQNNGGREYVCGV